MTTQAEADALYKMAMLYRAAANKHELREGHVPTIDEAEEAFSEYKRVRDNQNEMKKVTPIKPSEVAKLKKNNIPSTVIEAFNDLIAKNFHGKSATVKNKDVEALLKQKGMNIDEVYANHWMDVEPIFQAQGWDVVFDGPAYCETYDAFFRFTAK